MSEPGKNRSVNATEDHPTGIKPTAEEYEKRVRQCMDLLCQGYHKGQIKDAIHERYGVDARTVENYLSRAREMLQEELDRSCEEHKSDVLGMYQKILRDSKAHPLAVLNALKGKREMLGLDAPKRTEISGPDGKAIALKQEKGEPFDYDGFTKLQRAMFGIPSQNGNGESVYPALPDAQTGGLPQSNGH